MATESIQKITATMGLNNGTDSEGNQRIVNVSLGTMSKNNWDGDKVLAICAALEPCLDKSLSQVIKGTTSRVTAGQ